MDHQCRHIFLRLSFYSCPFFGYFSFHDGSISKLCSSSCLFSSDKIYSILTQILHEDCGFKIFKLLSHLHLKYFSSSSILWASVLSNFIALRGAVIKNRNWHKKYYKGRTLTALAEWVGGAHKNSSRIIIFWNKWSNISLLKSACSRRCKAYRNAI